MSGPLLESKLRVPRPRRALVARPRLDSSLGRGLESELMLVSAPAGFGKTTLLAEWLTGSATADRTVSLVVPGRTRQRSRRVLGVVVAHVGDRDD